MQAQEQADQLHAASMQEQQAQLTAMAEETATLNQYKPAEQVQPSDIVCLRDVSVTPGIVFMPALAAALRDLLAQQLQGCVKLDLQLVQPDLP